MAETRKIIAPKKLIEVALPLDDINKAAAREKSMLSEKKSWEANAAKIANLLELAHVPDDVYVAFESSGKSTR